MIQFTIDYKKEQFIKDYNSLVEGFKSKFNFTEIYCGKEKIKWPTKSGVYVIWKNNDNSLNNLIYVGMTGKTIEERYEEHTNPQNKNYKKGSKWMKKHGVRGFSEALAIDLLSHPNISRETLTFGEALQNEKLYAEWLRSEGFGVWWG